MKKVVLVLGLITMALSSCKKEVDANNGTVTAISRDELILGEWNLMYINTLDISNMEELQVFDAGFFYNYTFFGELITAPSSYVWNEDFTEMTLQSTQQGGGLTQVFSIILLTKTKLEYISDKDTSLTFKLER